MSNLPYPTTTVKQPSRILTRSRLKNSDRWMDYVLAGLLFAASALGNVAAYNGGFEATFNGAWNPAAWTISGIPFLAGVSQQILLQWRQFANSHGQLGDRLRNGRYVTALLLSAGPSLWTFWPVLAATLGAALASIVAVVVVLAVDVLQEELLLQD